MMGEGHSPRSDEPASPKGRNAWALGNPADYVRREPRNAIAKPNFPIPPILMNGTSMPTAGGGEPAAPLISTAHDVVS